MVLRKIKLEQIVSLQLDTIPTYYTTELCPLSMFTNVTTLILLNLQLITQINSYTTPFPKLNCLSLWYDNETNCGLMTSIFLTIRNPIKRFEIHYAGSVCTHCFADYMDTGYMRNTTTEYFLFDAAQHPLLPITSCFRAYNACFLMSIVDFVKYMHSIRYVRIITNKYNLHKLLDYNEWKRLAIACYHLEKVTLQVSDIMLQDKQLMQKIMQTQNELYCIRATIKFQVLFA
jgi:hypothetical protein